jgi:NADP-dependent 3-hydroxy acid dehydrogenase YdfG
MADPPEGGPRTILLTGASSGIGRATCERLLQRGDAVIGLARDFSKFPATSARFFREVVDLERLADLPGHLEAIRHRHPGVDGLVLNAGRGDFGSLEEFSFEQIRSLIDLNLTSTIYVVRAFLPSMKERKRGDVVFIGSEAALRGGKRGAIYAATKVALRGLGRALREECSRSGIRVSVIHPGMVRTPFYGRAPFEPGADDAEHLLADDVAKAVVDVLSARQGAVFDEVHLSPLKRVIHFRKPGEKEEG